MHAQLVSRSADRIILSLAKHQHSAVARAQLLAVGVSRQEIATRLADGRLEPIFRGVYLVGGSFGKHTLAQAALLAVRDGALSHLTAAAIWQLRDIPTGATPWVTARAQSSRCGVNVCRAILMGPDLRSRHGLRVTSPPRTVLDCAALIDDEYELEALVAEARYRGLASEQEILRQIQRNPRKRGVARLRAVIDLAGGPQRTRSGGEREFLRILRAHGFSGYRVNSRTFGPELDFVWPELRFAVELDGWDGHSGRVAFERDRLKIAELQARGVEVMPVTGRQLRDESAVVRRLEAALLARADLMVDASDRE